MSACVNDDCKLTTTKLETEIERLRDALESIANPIGYMIKTMPEGHKLDGMMTVMMSQNHNYLQNLAISALKTTDECFSSKSELFQ